MERKSEPELMNEAEQAAAYANADFEEPNSRFVDIFKTMFPDVTGETMILDLGCGPGDILARIARAYPHSRCVGIDGAGQMLALARAEIARQGLTQQVAFVEARIPSAIIAAKAFDVIVSNSLLHHLPDPHVLWQALKRHGRKKCRVLVVDLLRPQSKDEAKEIVARYSGNEPEILRQDFFNSLLASYTLDEVAEQLEKEQLRHLRLAQVSDRHFAVSGII